LPSTLLQIPANRSLINLADLDTLTKINFRLRGDNADSPEEDSASASPFAIVTTDLENAVLTLSSMDDNQNPNPFTCQQLSQPMPDGSPSQTRETVCSEIIRIAKDIRSRRNGENDLLGALDLTFDAAQKQLYFPQRIIEVSPTEGSAHLIMRYQLSGEYIEHLLCTMELTTTALNEFLQAADSAKSFSFGSSAQFGN
jgi:hypothetical protein